MLFYSFISLISCSIVFEDCLFRVNSGPARAINVHGEGEVYVISTDFMDNNFTDSVIRLDSNITGHFQNVTFMNNTGVDIRLGDNYTFDTICFSKGPGEEIPAVMQDDEEIILADYYYNCDGEFATPPVTPTFVPTYGIEISRLDPDFVPNIAFQPYENLSFSTNSQSDAYPIANAFDTDINSSWKSYTDSDGQNGINGIGTGQPILAIVELLQPSLIRAFSFRPDPDEEQNYAGAVNDFEIYASNSSLSILQDSSIRNTLCYGSATYINGYSDDSIQYYNLPQEITAKYFAFGIRSYQGSYSKIANIEIFQKFIVLNSEGTLSTQIDPNVINYLHATNQMPHEIPKGNFSSYTNSLSNYSLSFYAIDENESTFYMPFNGYYDNYSLDVIYDIQGNEPVLLILDLDVPCQVRSFGIYPGVDSNMPLNFEIYTGTSLEEIRSKAKTLSSVAHGEFDPFSPNIWQYYNIGSEYDIQYFGLGIRTHTGNQTYIGEINLFSEEFPTYIPSPSETPITPSETPITPSETLITPSETPITPSETPTPSFAPSNTFPHTAFFTPDSLVPTPRKHNIIKIGLFLFLILEATERIH